MIGDPDPYTATMNALQFFRVDDIVISTLPATRSGWLRADLIERVREASNKPVEHVESAEPGSRPPPKERPWKPPPIAHARARPPRPAAGEPLARGSSPSCSGCCFSSSPR